MSKGDEGRSSYLDLLISTITEHEKNMDKILEKLEEISEALLIVFEQARLKTGQSVVKKEKGMKEDDLDTLIYMKLKIDHPLEHVLKILESLKE